MDQSWGAAGAAALGAAQDGRRTKLFANAWYDASAKVWPPPPHIDPVMMALHFQGGMPKAYGPEAVKYYNERWPVGTRDPATQDMLLSKAAVTAVWSGDLTWTLAPMCPRDATATATATATTATATTTTTTTTATTTTTTTDTTTTAAAAAAAAATNVVIVDVDPEVLKKVVPASVIANATFLTHFAYHASMTTHELARYAGVFGREGRILPATS